MKNYIGKKIRGFSFEDGIDGILFNEKYTLNHIGKIGEIISQGETYVNVQFKNERCYYPILLIEQHLVNEDLEIPHLGDGLLMEVSNDFKKWNKELVIEILSSGLFIDEYTDIWKYARPIQELAKYTHAQLVEKLGHDFEYIK